MNSSLESSATLGHGYNEYPRKESPVEVLKLASTVLERNEGFKTAIRVFFQILEKQCRFLGARLEFIDGVVDGGNDIRLKDSLPLKTVIEDAIAEASKSVLMLWRSKMVPVMVSKV